MSNSAWPQRAALLAGLGAAVGLASEALLSDTAPPSLAVQASVAGMVSFGLIFALLWDRTRLLLALAFAGSAGVVVAGGTWFSSGVAGRGSDPWHLLCAMIAVAVATPLFHSWRDAPPNGQRVPYDLAHDRAWTGLVTVGAGFAFTLVSWLLAWLLAGLFGLIGIDVLTKLMEYEQFAAALLGAALGGGLGLARDQAAILSTLQRVLRFVLSALAPVLALGLALFLLALPITGLTPLWAATKSTTPILLCCVAGALVLANSIIADVPADESQRRVLRVAAGVLLAAMLPLALIAGVSVGLRIEQHGITPDRLWAATVVAVALAYGAAALWALLRPAAWMARVRAGNLVLGFGLCAIALLLATPLADFGHIATQSQLARLASGRVKPADFDWAALRHDFGPSGIAALRKLAKGPGETATLAARSLKSENRWDMAEVSKEQQKQRTVAANLLVLPIRRPAPTAIIAALAADGSCTETEAACVLYWPADAASATAFVSSYGWQGQSILFRLTPTGWQREDAAREFSPADRKRVQDAIRAGRAEVRMVERPTLFVDGNPVPTQ